MGKVLEENGDRFLAPIAAKSLVSGSCDDKDGNDDDVIVIIVVDDDDHAYDDDHAVDDDGDEDFCWLAVGR